MTGFSPKVRKVIGRRARDYTDVWATCEIMAICQGAQATAAHHRRPRGAGGSRRVDTNEAANGLATCDPCHFWVESNREKAFRFGWLLRQTQTPCDVPVLRRGAWTLLDNEGSFTPVPAPIGGVA